MPDSRISFSQFQMWSACPKRWKLKYIDNIRIEGPSVAAMFGTAMHEVLQEYLTIMYNSTIKNANELDLNNLLKTKLKSLYKELLTENDNVHFSNSSELSEYYEDGVAIIEYFKKNRDSIFPKKTYELVGVEVPIDIIASDKNKNVKMIGFLDIVIKDTATHKYYIYDFKTSVKGWGDYQKKDTVKVSQLVLYKKYFSEQYNCDPNKISIAYIILKRKILENAEYSAMSKRIQRFVPAHGTVSIKKITNSVDKFISTVFNEDGSYNTGIEYKAVAGFNNSNCKFCEYKGNEELCPKQERIV